MQVVALLTDECGSCVLRSKLDSRVTRNPNQIFLLAPQNPWPRSRKKVISGGITYAEGVNEGSPGLAMRSEASYPGSRSFPQQPSALKGLLQTGTVLATTLSA